ncbi:hypothetical protein JOD43_002953 [Pullulanibacillus pueri]|uniref:Uncharacterized protein n=1 Tax=Pullulanibacillus pueri TaxID=1437324 RepID=A0A8J3EMK0_9BACL|nr:hypothetical protein [Pullulanibacillus pueri]GGH83134.1 hypothetical protein GCM10007096_23550 [Pullulanibacillus pueri]
MTFKKATIICLTLLLLLLGLYMLSNYSQLNPKPKVVFVTSASHISQNQPSKLTHFKITNQKEVQKMYRILIHSPNAQRSYKLSIR